MQAKQASHLRKQTSMERPWYVPIILSCRPSKMDSSSLIVCSGLSHPSWKHPSAINRQQEYPQQQVLKYDAATGQRFLTNDFLPIDEAEKQGKIEQMRITVRLP